MLPETLHNSLNLLQRLAPVLEEIQGKDPQQRYTIVKDWFSTHTENLATDLKDLALLCTLSDEDRRLLTYPVMGNWILNKLSYYLPETPLQEEAMVLLTYLVAESRFNSSPYNKEFYENTDAFTTTWDALGSLILTHPDETEPVRKSFKDACQEIANFALGDKQHIMQNGFVYVTMDFPHALMQPAEIVGFLMFHAEFLITHELAAPLTKTIMVIDDEAAEKWYEKMLAAGFAQEDGQQGYFADCESALAALQRGEQYDVILTDADLGEGKMSGIEFVKAAHAVLGAKKHPFISMFSYNQEQLIQAERELGSLVDQQITCNNKAEFTATAFRGEVTLQLRNRSQL